MIGTLLLYNFVLLSSTFFVWLSEKNKDNTTKYVYLYIAFLSVFFLSAFRYGIGKDYFNYLDIFIDISQNGKDFNYDGRIEIGYLWLNQLISFLGLSYDSLVIVVSFIFTLFIFLSYPKKNKAVFHFFIFGVYFFVSFNLLRNSIAFAISLFAIMNFYFYNKNLKYFFFILVSSLFHISSLILIPFILINKELSKFIFSKKITLLTLVIIAFIFRNQVTEIILMSPALSLFGYDSYATKQYYLNNAALGTGLGVLIKALFVFSPILISDKESRKTNPNDSRFLIFLLAYVFVYIFSISIEIFSRLEKIFYFAYPLAAILIMSNLRFFRYRKLVVLLMGFIVLIDYNRYIINSSTDYMVTCHGGRISPYVSIFNKEDSKRIIEYTWHIDACEKAQDRNL